jgi:hypothetical protein
LVAKVDDLVQSIYAKHEKVKNVFLRETGRTQSGTPECALMVGELSPQEPR